jgi:hypothetical protein
MRRDNDIASEEYVGPSQLSRVSPSDDGWRKIVSLIDLPEEVL